MNIVFGKFYENRTKKYLLPCLKGHGPVFLDRYKTIFKLAVGIHDTLLDGSDKASTKNIYLLCDAHYRIKAFKDFLTWIRYEDYYVCDYSIESEIENPRRHMIVLTVPKEFESTYEAFLEGRYSEMYNSTQINDMFTEKLIRQVLRKDLEIAPKVCDLINKEFESSLNIEDLKGLEYEFPVLSVKPETEIFHYKKK